MLCFLRDYLSLAYAPFISILVLTSISKVKAEELTPSNNSLGISTTDKSTNSFQQVSQYVEQNSTPVTSVSQLSDVQPNDWAFQVLQSLVERYGCIAGYPDGGFKGNRSMTRFEFAVALNTCLNRVNERIATDTKEMVVKDDLATVQKLQKEFAAEMLTLRGRVDALETHTAQLEKQQFSKTIKLDGQLILAPVGASGSAGNNNITVSDRLRLNLKASFKQQLEDNLRNVLSLLEDRRLSQGYGYRNISHLISARE